MNVLTIRPSELFAKCRNGEHVDLVDVRTPVEFRELHSTFAKNIPLSDLDPNAVAAMRSANQPLYVICKSGGRGKQACEKLINAGHANIFNVEGGTTAWAEAGLPVNRGKKAMSLERQVRIVAGLLVLIGLLLSYFVHPYCIGLSAFVGAGLVFAGVTDTCTMGLILAKMPWNKIDNAGQTCKTTT